MKINKLKFSGFKYADEKLEINHTFYPHTKIYGDNFLGKTTVLEAICWCFTGCNISGNNNYNQYLLNNNSENMYVEIEFSDNSDISHVLRREKDEKILLYLDNNKISQTIVEQEFIYSKNVFLSVLSAEYFLGLSPKDARELMEDILPNISNDDIYDRLTDNHKKVLMPKDLDDINFFLRKSKSRLKELNEEETYLRGQISTFKSVPNKEMPKCPKEIDEKNLNNEIEKLEKKKLELLSMKVETTDTSSLIKRRDLLQEEYTIVKRRLQKPIQTFSASKCPICKQTIPQNISVELNNDIQSKNDELVKRLDSIKSEGQTINEQLVLLEKENLDKNPLAEKYTNDIKELDEKISMNKKILSAFLLKNAEYNAYIKNEENRKKRLVDAREKYDELNDEIKVIYIKLAAAKLSNVIKSQMQMESVLNHFKHVHIEFEKVSKSTGELIQCFNIKYDNKNVFLLSNSEKIRATLEISNLINEKTGLMIPIFIDNAESITHYEKPAVQVFEAIVKKGSSLLIVEENN